MEALQYTVVLHWDGEYGGYCYENTIVQRFSSSVLPMAIAMVDCQRSKAIPSCSTFPHDPEGSHYIRLIEPGNWLSRVAQGSRNVHGDHQSTVSVELRRQCRSAKL